MRYISLICFAIVILLSSGIAHAEDSLSCDMDPKELWIDANTDTWLTQNFITINCTCSGITASAILEDNTGIISEITLENSSGYYTGNILFTETLLAGDYTLSAYCNRHPPNTSTNMTTSIAITELSSRLVSSQPPLIYPEDVLDLKVELKSNSEPITTGASFNVYLGPTHIPLQGTPVYASGSWNLKAKIPDTYDNYGTQDLTITSTDNGRTITLTTYDYSEVEPLIKINILDPPFFTPYRLTDTKDIEVRLDILYKKDPIDKSYISGFKAKLDNKEIKIEKIEYVEDEWLLLINIPKLTPQQFPYHLNIYVDYKDIWAKSYKSIPVQFDISFDGTLSDAVGKPASDIDIKFKSNVFEEKIKTNTNGHYSAFIPPAEYTIELSFPQFQAILTEADLYSDINDLELIPHLIQYDYLESTELGAKKTIFLRFALPHKNTFLKIPYSDSDFTKEDDILIFRCDTWNFKKRTCQDDWTESDATIDTNRNLISILTSSSSSAFQILEKKSIDLDLSLDKDRYALDEKVTLAGKLLDENLNAVTDAAIIYKIGSISGQSTTGSDGYFSATFNAPNIVGTYDLDIEAKKDPYSLKKTIGLTTYKKRALSISSPSSIDLDLDIPSDISFTVNNPGQEPLEDISIIVSGIPKEWYELASTNIGRLEIGETEDISLNLLLSKDHCDSHDCEEQHTLKITTQSGTTRAVSETSLKINIGDNKESSASPSSESANGKILDMPVTGFSTTAISTRGIIILLLPLIAIILISGLKKIRKSDLPARHSLDRLISEVKQEVLKSTDNDLDSSIRSSLANPQDRNWIDDSVAHDIPESKEDIAGLIKNPFSKTA